MVRRDISPARPGQRDPTFRNMSPLMLLTLSGLLLVQSAQDLSYFDDGLDWGGICVTSKQQSPINLVSTQYTPASSASPSAFTFGTGTNVNVCFILFEMHLHAHACANRCICAVSVARNHILRLCVAMQQHTCPDCVNAEWAKMTVVSSPALVLKHLSSNKCLSDLLMQTLQQVSTHRLNCIAVCFDAQPTYITDA